MYKRILLAYDGTESGQKALLDCRDLAQWGQSELSLVAVMPVPTNPMMIEGGLYDGVGDEELKATYESILDDGLQRLSLAGRRVHGELLAGDPVREITEYARKIEADLIVVGHKHLDGWAARWWRSATSPALIEHAPCSVLVVITH
ncbi:MAG: universal stress protein [Burkholderiales bacterium]|nr:universal stress protein [Burkholderiales bacterium]GIK87720.1 MAG: universal stress protein A [Betaproteobacteria bacterium]